MRHCRNWYRRRFNRRFPGSYCERCGVSSKKLKDHALYHHFNGFFCDPCVAERIYEGVHLQFLLKEEGTEK